MYSGNYEERKHENKARRPWPTKAQLGKQSAKFVDKQDRSYYEITDIKEYEWIQELVKSEGSTAQALWIRLPKKTTLGGMPESQTAIETTTGEKWVVRQCPAITGRKERGTGLVIVTPKS